VLAGEVLFIDSEWRLSEAREPAHAKVRIIPGECAPRVIGKPDAQGIKRDMGCRSRGCQPYFAGFLNNGYRPRLPIPSNNGHGAVIQIAALWEKPNTKQIWSKRGHFDSSRAGAQANF
jgi:hypothetical protein